MGTLNVANLNHTGNTFTTSANLNLGGSWVDAPVGTCIKTGTYNTGYGSGARTTISTSSWTTVNINGTGQAGMNIGKWSDDIITYSKISNKSHLTVQVMFPYYLSPGASPQGFGIKCWVSPDGGSNYYELSGLGQGAVSSWGGGGYAIEAGVFPYTWCTYDVSANRSSFLARTGQVRIYFETRTHNTTDTLYLNDYDNTYPKQGTIQVQEIIAE